MSTPSLTLLKEIPLAGSEAFRASRLDRLCDLVETRLGAKCIRAETDGHFNAVANRHALPLSELWFCDYGIPISLRFSEGDYLRVQFQFSGQGTTHTRGEAYPITAQRACISHAAATIDFGRGFQQLVWRIKRDVVVRKLTALTGKRITHDIEFNRVLRLDAPATFGLAALKQCILTTIATQNESVALVLTELEQALIVSLLCSSEHNFRHELLSSEDAALPRHVRQIEEYLDDHLDEPFDIEKLVFLTGKSARSIYRAFKLTRGYSPMEFLRQRRLIKARELLRSGDLSQSITSIAFTCGFSDVSQFSHEFSRVFGISPSAFRLQQR